MNRETLTEIRDMAVKLRAGVVRNDYDQRQINTLILSFIAETINYELDRTKESATQIYQ